MIQIGSMILCFLQAWMCSSNLKYQPNAMCVEAHSLQLTLDFHVKNFQDSPQDWVANLKVLFAPVCRLFVFLLMGCAVLIQMSCCLYYSLFFRLLRPKLYALADKFCYQVWLFESTGNYFLPLATETKNVRNVYFVTAGTAPD